MKKFFVFIVGLFIVGTVFAVGENIPTSKTYVDNAVAQKQNTISANNGVAQVLTNTGTAGTIGTKNIYDSSAAYETQTNSLVTAGTMNTAVQNAIDSEFVCIERNAHGECLLLEIRNVVQSLPSGYTRLEYLESDRNQWIMTNIPWTSVGRFRGKAQQSDIDGMNLAVFGSTGFGPNYLSMFWGSYYFSSQNGKTEWYWNTNILPTTVAEFDIVRDGNTAWHGTVNNVNTSVPNAAFAGNVVLLSTNNGDNTYESRGFHGNIWYLQLFGTDGNILFNFIPARRDSDGVLGMYDTVTNTFFTNSGTGEFIAGPVSHLYLPSGN